MIEEHPTSQPVIYVIGDSISLHYGTYLEQHVRGRFLIMRSKGDEEAKKNLDIPQGSNAGDSRSVLHFLKARLRMGNFAPQLLLVNCGLHDIKRNKETNTIQIPLEEYMANLHEIVALVKSNNIPLAWVQTTHSVDLIHNEKHAVSFLRYSADNDTYRQAADKIMSKEQIPVIDLHRLTKNIGPDEILFCDHVHFVEPVRQQQAAFIAGWINGFTYSPTISQPTTNN